MMQIIFFAVSFIVVFAGQALFWYVLVKFLNLTTLEGRLISGLIVGFLFISVILASYLIHKWDNLFTRWYYIFAGFWIGLLVNFGLATALIIIIKLAGFSFGFTLPGLYLKIIFFGGALILSVIGALNAGNPKVTEYTVYIKDLPESWNNKTVVQISDVHLGPVYRAQFFSRLLKKAQNLNPEAIFITGDLFDGMESDFTWLNHPFTKLNIPRGIYYSFGNHDLYLGFNRAMELLKGNPITILDDKMVTVDGLQIIGINYSFNKDFDLEEAILRQVGYDRAKPSLLLFHEPKNIALAKNAEIDLQLSGHTHQGQLWPFNILARLIYKGHGYGLFSDGDFSLIVNRGAGTWGPPMRTTGCSEIVKIILKKK
jgi:hypothetical protein